MYKQKILGVFLLLIFGFTIFAQDRCTPKEVITEIEISCSAEKLWQVLFSANRYPEWHPYLIIEKGEFKKGKKIKAKAINTDSTVTRFSAFVLEVEPNRKLSWGGSLGFIFRAKHYFIIQELEPNRVKLIQGEYWRGIFGKRFGRRIYLDTYQKFNTMNVVLKKMLE